MAGAGGGAEGGAPKKMTFICQKCGNQSLLSQERLHTLSVDTQEERQLADGRGGEGVGEEPNHAMTRKPVPL